MVMFPESKTCAERSSISVNSSLISVSEIPYLFFIRGRLRTSAISSSIGLEIITRRAPSSNNFLNLAGNPEGFNREETQILVSITTLIGIFSCLTSFIERAISDSISSWG